MKAAAVPTHKKKSVDLSNLDNAWAFLGARVYTTDGNGSSTAKADQGKISGGSISRIVQNTLVNICTNFGAFMKSRTIGLLCCSTIVFHCGFLIVGIN